MRKNFVLFVLVPLIATLVIAYLFVDGWVESGLEAGGEAIVGAKVEIDNLRLSLSPLGIEWQRMQVANPDDPWKNFFETGKVRFAMDFGQLLRSKYIIETMEVNELIIGTKRTTNGSLPDHKSVEPSESGGMFTSLAEEALKKTVEQTPIFNLDLRKGINADSLVKALDIRTLKHIDSLRQQTLKASEQWNATLSDLESSKQKLAELETNLKAINPSELKSVDKITAAITTVDNAAKSIGEIKKAFDERQTAVTTDIQRLNSAVGSIDDIARMDFQRLLGMASLPNLNTSGIAQLLVGEEMYHKAMGYLRWVDVGRTYVKKYSPEPGYESPPRMKGQDIHFPVERGYPKFWIKKVAISGGTDKTQHQDFIYAQGGARNISDNQVITGSPLTITMEGTQAGKRSLTLGALLDRTKDVPYDEYNVSLSGVPLAEFNLGKSDFLPTKVSNARMNSSLTIAVPGEYLDARTRLEFSNVTMQFDAEPRNVIERLVHDVLKSITGFTVTLRLWKSDAGFDMALATNLADQIAGKVKDALGAEFARLQSDLRSQFDATINQKRQEFERTYTAKREEAKKKIRAYQSLIAEKTALIESKKKELTNRLEKEKKGTLEGLKKLLK